MDKKTYSFGDKYTINLAFVIFASIILLAQGTKFGEPILLIFPISILILAMYKITFKFLKNDTLFFENRKLTKTNTLFMKRVIILDDYKDFNIETIFFTKSIYAIEKKSNLRVKILQDIYSEPIDDILKYLNELVYGIEFD